MLQRCWVDTLSVLTDEQITRFEVWICLKMYKLVFYKQTCIFHFMFSIHYFLENRNYDYNIYHFKRRFQISTLGYYFSYPFSEKYFPK